MACSVLSGTSLSPPTRFGEHCRSRQEGERQRTRGGEDQSETASSWHDRTRALQQLFLHVQDVDRIKLHSSGGNSWVCPTDWRALDSGWLLRTGSQFSVRIQLQAGQLCSSGRSHIYGRNKLQSLGYVEINKDMKLELEERGIREEYEQNTLIEILTVYKDWIVIKTEITKVFSSQRNLL